MRQQEIKQLLESANGIGKVRLLDIEDVKDFVKKAEKARKKMQKYNLQNNIEGRIDGGGVCNSYRYKAETSAIIFNGKEFKGVRTCAKKAAYGVCSSNYIRVYLRDIDADIKKQLKKDFKLERINQYLYI